MPDSEVDRWADMQAAADAELEKDPAYDVLDDLRIVLNRATHFPGENVPKVVELIDTLIKLRVEDMFERLAMAERARAWAAGDDGPQ